MVIFGQLRMKDNVLHGIGRKITFFGDLGHVLVLEGQWVEGKLTGFGRRLHTNGSCYIGHYKESWRWGFGRANYSREMDDKTGNYIYDHKNYEGWFDKAMGNWNKPVCEN